MGVGASISTAVSERTAVVIEDYMFDASTVGELKPEESPSDFHDTWDLDGTDFTPEASPDDEGYWDDFENIVLNGNYEELGSELLSQPVDLQTDFTAVNGASFTDANTLVTTGGSIEGFTKSSFLTVGKTYKLIIAGTTTSSGFTLGNTTGSGNEYGSGFGTHYFTASGNTAFWLRQGSAGTTNITSFSIKQVDPNDRWQLQSSGNSSSSITDKLTISVDNGDFASARQALSLSNGNTYELSFDLTSNNSNTSIAIRDDDGAAGGLTETVSLNFTGTQTKSFIFTANANSDAFFTKRQSGSGTYTYSIDNVVVKEYAITPLDV